MLALKVVRVSSHNRNTREKYLCNSFFFLNAAFYKYTTSYVSLLLLIGFGLFPVLETGALDILVLCLLVYIHLHFCWLYCSVIE